MNQYLKPIALIFVGVGGLYCLYLGQYTPGVGLLCSILAYVFGNSHGQREKPKWP